MTNNLATIAAVYEAFGQGNIPLILSHLADSIRWESWADNTAQNAGIPWLQSRQGKEGVLQFFEVVGSLNIKEFQVLSLMAGPNQVAAEVVIGFESPHGGYYRDEELHLWTFDEAGKVTRMRHYTDTAKHIAAWQG